MTDASIGFPEAARRLGVPLRILRRAIRAGKLPAPPHAAAAAALPAEWLDAATTAVEASPRALGNPFRQKAPAFARYEGTSAWRKYRHRAREYARFRAAAGASNPGR